MIRMILKALAVVLCTGAIVAAPAIVIVLALAASMGAHTVITTVVAIASLCTAVVYGLGIESLLGDVNRWARR